MMDYVRGEQNASFYSQARKDRDRARAAAQLETEALRKSA